MLYVSIVIVFIILLSEALRIIIWICTISVPLDWLTAGVFVESDSLREAPTTVLCDIDLMWRRETNTATVCDVECGAERQTLLPPCVMLNVAQRDKHCHRVWCRMWCKETNIATVMYDAECHWCRETNIATVCDVECGARRQTLPQSCMMLNVTDVERQTLPPCVMLNVVQTDSHCHLAWCWICYGETKHCYALFCIIEYDAERLKLASCMTWCRIWHRKSNSVTL